MINYWYWSSCKALVILIRF